MHEEIFIRRLAQFHSKFSANTWFNWVFSLTIRPKM